MGINDWGSAGDRQNAPKLGSPGGWADSVAKVLNESDVTVDDRIAASLSAAGGHQTRLFRVSKLDQQAVTAAQQAWQQAQAELTPEATDNLNAAILTAQGQATGDPWRQPSGVQDAYPNGWQVTHSGKTWESLTTANVWEPGTYGWTEVI